MSERSPARDKAEAPAERADVPALEGLAGYLADPDARNFDRLIYERVRLGIMSALSVNDSMTFSELKELFRTSDGNLSSHARKLEDAGYVRCRKTFQRRLPRTEYKLTRRGRTALTRYLDHMESLIQATRKRPTSD